jgi:hypothetical protein
MKHALQLHCMPVHPYVRLFTLMCACSPLCAPVRPYVRLCAISCWRLCAVLYCVWCFLIFVLLYIRTNISLFEFIMARDFIARATKISVLKALKNGMSTTEIRRKFNLKSRNNIYRIRNSGINLPFKKLDKLATLKTLSKAKVQARIKLIRKGKVSAQGDKTTRLYS